MSIVGELLTLLNDHQKFHSNFQMDNFITARAGGTAYGRYKQALRELNSRYHTLKNEYIDLELLRLDVNELENQLDIPTTPKKRRVELELMRNRMRLDAMERTMQDRIRETARFFAQARALKQDIGELTPEKRDIFERELWLFMFRKQAAIDIRTTARISPNTLEGIYALPIEPRKALLDELKRPQELLDAVESNMEEMPDVPLLVTEVEALQRMIECSK